MVAPWRTGSAIPQPSPVVSRRQWPDLRNPAPCSSSASGSRPSHRLARDRHVASRLKSGVSRRESSSPRKGLGRARTPRLELVLILPFHGNVMRPSFNWLGLPARPVISGIEAGIVELPVHSEPVGPVNAARRCRPRTRWERRDHLEPAVGAPRDVPDFSRNFREILILTEYNSYIELAVARHTHHVQSDSQVDSLFALDRKLVDGTVRQTYLLDPVAQGSGSDGDTASPHRGQTPSPVPMPHRGPVRARDTGIEPDLMIDPAALCADRFSEPARIVVRMMVAKRVLRVTVQDSARR